MRNGFSRSAALFAASILLLCGISTAAFGALLPPMLVTTFIPASITLGSTTGLQFDITNPGTVTLTGVNFNDTLPANLTVPNASASVCGGTVTLSGGNTISITGATILPGNHCIFTVTVTGTVVANYLNATTVADTTAGTGNTATASLTVTGAPVFVATFVPPSISLGSTTGIQYTITNPGTNTASLTGVAFNDTLPAGLSVPNASASVCGGTVTLSGGNNIALVGGTIAPGTSCIFTVTVTGNVVGSYLNLAILTSTNGGPGVSSVAPLTVTGAPTFAMTFIPASITLGSTTGIQYTITNPGTNTASLTGVAFNNTLPAGLSVPNASASVCGGTVTLSGGNNISITGATITPGTSCIFTVTVTGNVVGTYLNSTTLTSTNGGPAVPATAPLTVTGAPTVTSSFIPASIPVGSTTGLQFIITNPGTNTASFTGVSFTDTLPAGLSVPNASASVCGGTVTLSGGNTVSITGATITPGTTCSFTVTVSGNVVGNYSVPTTVTSTNGGASNTATAPLAVTGAPTLATAFIPTVIAVGATTGLQFTITAPGTNIATLTGVGFSDTLPAGLTVPNASATLCGGTVTLSGGNNISLAGATLAPGASCIFTVTVTGAVGGSYTNPTTVTSTNGGTSNTASATLAVGPAPTMTKSFGGATVALNATTTLTLTIHNPIASAGITAVAFTDTFPAGLVVAPTPGVSNTCGGTATAVAGAASVALSAGAIAASGSCTVTVNVQATTLGTKTNTTLANANSGISNTATASIIVTALPVVTTFSGPTATGTGTGTVSFTGGGATCSFAPQGTGALQSAFFIPLSGSPKSPPTPPPGGIAFPEGLLDFVLTGCDGTPVTFTVTYPVALPPGAVYWKFGPTTSNTTPHWYILPVTFGSNTATFTITDGGLGDDDLTVNGTIVDQGGPAVPAPGISPQVPTMSDAMLALMALLLATLGAWHVRRARTRGASS
jgi:uncharacterized repeat protein (TIGR01451 family)